MGSQNKKKKSMPFVKLLQYLYYLSYITYWLFFHANAYACYAKILFINYYYLISSIQKFLPYVRALHLVLRMMPLLFRTVRHCQTHFGSHFRSLKIKVFWVALLSGLSKVHTHIVYYFISGIAGCE